MLTSSAANQIGTILPPEESLHGCMHLQALGLFMRRFLVQSRELLMNAFQSRAEIRVRCEVQGERFDSPLHAFSACIQLPLPFSESPRHVQFHSLIFHLSGAVLLRAATTIF
jgi:hypothetical protein